MLRMMYRRDPGVSFKYVLSYRIIKLGLLKLRYFRHQQLTTQEKGIYKETK